METKKPILFFDIEADGLLYEASQIWCIVAKDEQKQFYTFTSGFDRFLEFSDRFCLCGHNIISYDLPLLKKLYGFEYDVEDVIDTHILSRLFNPDREAHSLTYFGNLFGFPKGDHTDFSKFSQEMLEYCIRDVDITERLYYHLLSEGDGWDWSEAIKLENNVWDVQQRQEQHGVLFDVDKAEILLDNITKEVIDIEEKVISSIPQRYKSYGEVNKVFLKNGEYTKSVKDWFDGSN